MTKESDLRRRALGFLSRREHSRAELTRKLSPHAESAEALSALIEEFERRGWLSEQRAAEQLVHARRGKFGSGRIRQDMLSKGIAEDVIAQALPQLKAGDLDAARAVWAKKFGSPARNAQERARQIRFLQGRGFALETALRIIKGGGNDD